MKVLITGGAGFVSSHIVDELISLGHQVYIVDNLSTGVAKHLNPTASFYNVNILDDKLFDIFSKIKPEVVIHQAAQIDVQTSIHKPVLDAEVNIVGTIRVLEACRIYGVKKIIYASSAAVYGTPLYLPIDEKHPIKPLSFYGISKHTPEHYIEVYSNLYDLDFTILRYANVYGIRQDPKGEGGVVSIFIDKLLTGQQPYVFGDGEQTRDFVYVKDVATANIAALKQGCRGIYNVSSNQQTSINELLRLMSEFCERPYAPVYQPSRPGDIVHSCLDNREAIKNLGWKPQYSIQTGLQETCDYYKAKYLNNN
ncbi:NAD-dependent epimerase/dehydratase family protein [Paenibacillus naphthalenovorans]|uniref:NAD-dependent epimerase/dehydratase family protein n=1 Tax=Paenibacillus naphthalenovorans TaxID=162209 RepID=UPI003D27FDE0